MLCKVTFKDGASIMLHENMEYEIVEYSNTSDNFNYHGIMSVTEASFMTDDIRSQHIEYLNKNINKRLGGILSP